MIQNARGYFVYNRTIALLLLFFFQASLVHNATADATTWDMANIAGCVGSFGSLLSSTVSSPTILRLVTDLTCLAASIRDDHRKGEDLLINLAAFSGSIISLISWWPMIKRDVNNPNFLARAFIDILQILLCGRRLLSNKYHNYKYFNF